MNNEKQNELLSDIASQNLMVDSLKLADRPDEFKSLSQDTLLTVIRQKTLLRDSLQKRMVVALGMRNKYIEQELAGRNRLEVERSFNNIIFTNIQRQARKKDIILQGKAKF